MNMFTILVCLSVQNGIAINEISCYNVHGGDGLVMKQNMLNFNYFNAKIDKLIGICYLTVHICIVLAK